MVHVTKKFKANNDTLKNNSAKEFPFYTGT